MKKYLFICLIFINIIIQGCTTATKDFFGNLEPYDNTSLKCDFFIDNLYTSDKIYGKHMSIADKAQSLLLLMNFPLLDNIQPHYEPITFLPIKDKKTGLACFEDETTQYYADIIDGIVYGEVIEYHKKSGKIINDYFVENGKVISYQGGFINPYTEMLDYYTVDYNSNIIELYNKNKLIAHIDMTKNISKYYYSNGYLSKELTFKNKKLDGISRFYYENGALQEERHYKNGLRNGNSERYNENGALWATITYINDKPVSGICGNGRKWTNAELINWENGVEVTCAYHDIK